MDTLCGDASLSDHTWKDEGKYCDVYVGEKPDNINGFNVMCINGRWPALGGKYRLFYVVYFINCLFFAMRTFRLNVCLAIFVLDLIQKDVDSARFVLAMICWQY